VTNPKTPVAGERYRARDDCETLNFEDDLGDIDRDVAAILSKGSRLRVILRMRNTRQRVAAITSDGEGQYIGSLTAYSAEMTECLKEGNTYRGEVTAIDLTEPAGQELVRIRVWYE
jgi:small nuclear ribonucleoprotein (snRNP)-like protein